MMDNQQLSDVFSELSTPLIADALVRLRIVPRAAPPGIRSLVLGTRLAGHVLPVRHYGSVDVFFEAMSSAHMGDILVIDNGGRRDQGCIGDLTALEAGAFGIAGMIVWGCHRDTQELIQMGFPVFSYGTYPFGPLKVFKQEPEALISAQFGKITVDGGDFVFADDDGVVFAPGGEIDRILNLAREIRGTERRQAEAIMSGETLHKQLQFDEYIAKLRDDPAYTFRKHLRTIGGAIEE